MNTYPDKFKVKRNMVYKYAKKARDAVQASEDGVVTMQQRAMLCRDEPRSGRPKLFTSPAQLNKIKKTIVKQRGRSLRWTGRKLGCCKETVRNYCKQLRIVPRYNHVRPQP